MSFFLVKLEPDADGNMIDVPIPDYGPYEKGSEAAKFAKVLTDQLGRKVQPRRISQAPDWRARQKLRLDDGTLRPLPVKWDLAPIQDHFAHLPIDDQSKIAFTESEELGIIDRVTVLTPGRYLTRFYPEVDDDKRRQLIAAIDPSGEIFYARMPDEIAKVYQEGPSSCMDAKQEHASFWDYPCWPTAPYGAGDLAVAYTVNNRGRIQSRTLCWPEKKQFGRVYGDIQRMTAAMKAEGYEDIRTDRGDSFVGAKLLKVPTGDPFEYVMPYFDDIEYAIDNGDHFITSDDKPEGGKYCNCGGSNGLSVMYQWCPKLKDHRSCSEFSFVHGANEEWSSPARRDHAFRCDATGETWSYDHRVFMRGGKKWSTKHFEAHGEKCSHSGNSCAREEMVTLSDGMRVHRDYKVTVDGKDVLHDPAILPRHRVGEDYKWYGSSVRDRLVPSETFITNPDLHISNNLEVAVDMGRSRATFTTNVRIDVDELLNVDDRYLQEITRLSEREMRRIYEQEWDATVVGDSTTRRHRVA